MKKKREEGDDTDVARECSYIILPW